MVMKCIINPAAGRGKTVKIWDKIAPQLKRVDPNMVYAFTQYPGHATELAIEARGQGIEVVLVLGGDGTLHEVMNGLVGGETALALIPTGTGNDYARSLGIPLNPLQAVRELPKWQPVKLDLGQMNGRYFINMGGIGFDAEVAHRVNQSTLVRGKLAYLVGILQTLAHYRAIEVEIEMDGHLIQEKIMLMAVGNAKYVGGGVMMLPQALPDDGQFDICLIKDTTKFDVLKTLPLLYQGKHLHHPKCSFYKAQEVVIRLAEGAVKSQLDGQVTSGEKFAYHIVPKAIRVLCPRTQNV